MSVDTTIDLQRDSTGHDHFFKGRIAGSFSEAVDGHIHAADTGANGSDGVGDGHAKIVVSVKSKLQVGKLPADAMECLEGYHRIPDTHGVGQSDAVDAAVFEQTANLI